MHIRRLHPADAPAYRRLMLQAYRLSPEAFTSSLAERVGLPLSWWEKRLADQPAEGETVLGAWQADQLQGAVGLRAELGERTRHKADVFGMAVAPEAQGQGLGAQLMQAVLAEAGSRLGLRQLRLSVSAGNVPAQRCYERAGFTVHGCEPMAVQHPAGASEGFVDKLMMGLTLPPCQDLWQLDEGELAEACLAERPHPADGTPTPVLRLRLSAAAVVRQRPPAAATMGHLAGLCLELLSPEPLPAPEALAALRGRLRELRLHHAQAAPAGVPQLPLPPPSCWADAATTDPRPLTWPIRLQLQTAQGDSLAVRAQALRLSWPAGARWQESWAC